MPPSNKLRAATLLVHATWTSHEVEGAHVPLWRFGGVQHRNAAQNEAEQGRDCAYSGTWSEESMCSLTHHARLDKLETAERGRIGAVKSM